MLFRSEHLNKVGFSLTKSVEAFNASVASWEGRVLPAARKFKTLGAESKKEIEELIPIEKQTRTIVAIDDLFTPFEEKNNEEDEKNNENTNS